MARRNAEQYKGGGDDVASPEARRRHQAFSAQFRVPRSSSSKKYEQEIIQGHGRTFWEVRWMLDPAYDTSTFRTVRPLQRKKN